MNEDAILKAVMLMLYKSVDDSIQKNAENASNAGLETFVTRRYDGVGLSGGRTCQWCLDRCGEDMPYREAQEKGAFQRHPGCGCELLYITEKGVQRQTDWTKNTWSDFQSKETLEQRKKTGILINMGPGSAEKRRKQILKRLAEGALGNISAN